MTADLSRFRTAHEGGGAYAGALADPIEAWLRCGPTGAWHTIVNGRFVVRDGEIERNGVGSIRSLRVAMLPAFEETVTAFVPNQLIEYRISKGSPLKNHRGVMTFAQSPDGCHLDYVIDFGAKIPGLDRLVKVGLARSIRTNLPRVESLA